jgi:hypothetical protein
MLSFLMIQVIPYIAEASPDALTLRKSVAV